MAMTITFDQLADLAGTDLGHAEYRVITQDQVNLFADAADDHQWIHVDPERANAGPYGAPIVHGYLSLSLTIPFWTELLDVKGVSTKINYGLDRVRFLTPVKVGSRVRMHASVAEVLQIPGGYQIAVDQTIEIEGVSKPAAVARGLYRFYA
jgi:acyl dehydratase